LSLTPIVRFRRLGLALGLGLGFALAFVVGWLVELNVGDGVGALGWDDPPVAGVEEIEGVAPPETLDGIDTLEALDALDGADAAGFAAAATPAANPPDPDPEPRGEVDVFCGTVVAEPVVGRCGVCALRLW
jgi:hypothetical protein